MTIGRKHQSWYLDSSNQKGKIIGIGEIGKHLFPSTDNVLIVEGLKHNLLSISQLCDSGYDDFYWWAFRLQTLLAQTTFLSISKHALHDCILERFDLEIAGAGLRSEADPTLEVQSRLAILS
ncbi:hypothetical protein CR513_08111, partial [Mucuna pruriens]